MVIGSTRQTRQKCVEMFYTFGPFATVAMLVVQIMAMAVL